MNRISWTAVGALVFLILAIVVCITVVEEEPYLANLALVLGMGSVTFALLALRDR